MLHNQRLINTRERFQLSQTPNPYDAGVSGRGSIYLNKVSWGGWDSARKTPCIAALPYMIRSSMTGSQCLEFHPDTGPSQLCTWINMVNVKRLNMVWNRKTINKRLKSFHFCYILMSISNTSLIRCSSWNSLKCFVIENVSRTLTLNKNSDADIWS